MTTAYSDKMLFARIAGGDVEAFREIFEGYRDRLYSVAFRLVKSEIIAEEMVQETFIGLWVSRKRISDVEKPDAYLYRVIYNEIHAYLRKESNRQRILQAAMHNRYAPVNTTEQAAHLNDLQRYIKKAMELLTPQQRSVYHLSRHQGFSIEEIGKHLKISPNTVKSHLSSALNTLRTHLKDVAIIATILQGLRCGALHF